MYAYYLSLSSWLTRGGFRQDAAVSFASMVLARAILIASMPFIARCFTPAEIGHWQLFVAAATIAGAVICWRYEVAIPLPAAEEPARDLLTVCLLLALGMSALLMVPVLLYRGPFAELIGAAELRPFLWCIPVFTFLFGCEQTSTYWLTRTGGFTSLGASRLLKSAVTVLVPLSAELFSQARFGHLVAATLLAQLATSAYLLRIHAPTSNLWRSSRERIHRLRQVMAEYRDYPLYVAPYAFVGQLSKRLVYFLLACFATASTVGLFAMAMQITYLPATLITSALNQAFYKRASAESDLRKLQPLVLKVLWVQAVGAVPLFTILAIHSKYLLVLFLGQGWEETAGFVACLAAPSLMLFFTAWLDRLFDSLGRQRLAVGMQIAYDAVSLGVLSVCLAWGQSALFSIACYCLVTTGYNVLWLVIAFKIAGFSLSRLFRLMLFAALLVLLMLAVHACFQTYLSESAALSLELATVVFVLYQAIRNLKGLWS